MKVSNQRLCVAYQTINAKLLENTGGNLIVLFKAGGVLDLMIGTSAKADTGRTNKVAGDYRLLVSKVNGKPLALLYRAVLPRTTNTD